MAAVIVETVLASVEVAVTFAETVAASEKVVATSVEAVEAAETVRGGAGFQEDAVAEEVVLQDPANHLRWRSVALLPKVGSICKFARFRTTSLH